MSRPDETPDAAGGTPHPDAAGAAPPGLCLVLGGGGVAALAWEVGVLCGLAEHGLDARRASRMIGTSAGAVVACRLAGAASLQELAGWAGGSLRQEPVDVDFPRLMRRLNEIGSRATGPAQARQEIGALALAAPTGSPRRRLAEVTGLIGRADWPADADLVVTAVDARSGEFVTFDRGSGAPLTDAVAASCAVPGVWPPVVIGDRVFVDGAVRSAVNASVAAGSDPVLVLAPQPGPGGLDREIRRIGPGVTVEVVAADADSVRAFGSNPLDAAAGPASLRAGLRQGRAAGDIARRLLDSGAGRGRPR